MHYSGIGIIAFLMLFITNFHILRQIKGHNLNPSHKAYLRFLCSVAIFYIIDIIWGPLYYLKNALLSTIETSIFFIVMSVTILFWIKYVIIYLNKKSIYASILSFIGYSFFVAETLVVILNFFVPIAFEFDDQGLYYPRAGRNINFIFQILMFIGVEIYMLISGRMNRGSARRRHVAIAMFGLIMILFIVLQLFYSFVAFYSMGYMVGTCLLYTFVLEDENEARLEHLESLLQVERIQEFELGTTRKMAYTDQLTGIKNRIAYFEDMGGVDQRIEDKALSNFGLLVFDVNDLKLVNDTYGHEAGDKHIKNACSLICTYFEHSPVYRIGGDEFVVFLTGEDYKNREIIFDKFSSKMKENLKNGGVIISSGFADYDPERDKTSLHLFNRADQNMYKCKQVLKTKKNTV